MSHDNPVRSIRKRRIQEDSYFVSVTLAGRQALRFLDKSILVFIILVAVFLRFGATIKFNFKPGFLNYSAEFQLKDLNPDAKLYYGLAENLVEGVGYYDTVRNEETLPSIGHPVFLAIFCVIAGLTPGQFSWLFFMLSFVFLAVSARIYCKSNLLAILSLLILGKFLKHIWWYAANVETTIIFANVLLAFVLAMFYKNNFPKLWAIICGLILYIHLAIRPLFLYPTHLFFIIFLVLFLYFYARKRQTAAFSFVRGWFVLLITAECLIWLTCGYSYLRYHDTRFVNGTYGAYPLYAGNNIYIPPDSVYDYRVRYPEEFHKMSTLIKDNPGMTWQQGQKILMQKVIDYWKQYPWRAVAGWWWRFRQFLGLWSGHFSWKSPLMVVHAFSTLTLLVLVVIRIASAFWSRNIIGAISDMKNSLGLLFAALFLTYSAIYAVFSYVGFRYASVVIPLLVAADIYLLCETIKSMWIAISGYSERQRV